MADSVQYAVSMTPIEEVASAEDGTIKSNIIWPGTNSSLGGSGSYDIGDIEDSIGYNSSSGTITKIICSTNTTSGNVLNASSAKSKGIFIKNTGFLASNTAQSSALTSTRATSTTCVTVTINSKIIASLGPGEAIFFPNNLGHANDLDPAEITVKASASENVAVEYLVLDA
tara:strand:- start:58 stop:570 length:513 start_codon:yes stop_codon:yes gene_type:complete